MFNVYPPTGVPGFRVRPEDDVPGFDIDENGLPRRERPWSGGMGPGSTTPQYPDLARAMMATPQYPDLAQAMMSTPGPEDSVQPAPPQLPDWLHTLLTMPPPTLPGSVPFAPLGWGHPTPFGMLFNPVRSLSTRDQNVREMGDVRADVARVTPPPALSAVEEPGMERPPSFDAPKLPADTDARHDGATAQQASPRLAGEEAMQDVWPSSPDDGQPYAQAALAGPQDLSRAEMAQQPTGATPPLSLASAADPNIVLANAGGDGVQEAQQQKPLPQNQQTPQKKPPAPSGTGQGKTPPAPRIPEKPGMEMTEFERRREQEFAELNKKWWRLKEADRRQPIWDKLTREPPKQTKYDYEFPDLLPDNWEEFLNNKIDPRYAAWTRAAAERHNIPSELLARLLYQESRYQKNQVSPQGARGIAQLMPDAVQAVGFDRRNPNYFDPQGNFKYFDPQASIDAGAAYLAQQYRRFRNWPKAVAAYNAGGGAVEGWLAGIGRDWSAVPEEKHPGWWKEINAHLQHVFRGKPEYFDR